MSNHTIFFISGLPRSGSTLLTSLLSENPDIYTSGNSPLCQLMWDTQLSMNNNCNEQFLSNNIAYKKSKILQSIPITLYEEVKKKYIFDKCRSWTLPDNLEIVKNYINKDFKIIILVRNIENILKSFMFIDNNKNYEKDLFIEYSDPLMRSLDGVRHCIEHVDKKKYFIINYDSLIFNTKKILEDLYKFLEIPYFDHNLNSIVNRNKENDDVYGIPGLHEVRPEINKRQYNVEISKNSKSMCLYLNAFLKKYL